MKFDFNAAKASFDYLEKERILRSLSALFSKEIQSCDTLSRFDKQTFALLIPHTSTAEAQHICNRLSHLFEERCNATEKIPVALTVGMAEFKPERDQNGADMIARASAILQK